jgi:polar amino acid transport system substrate-binding protein
MPKLLNLKVLNLIVVIWHLSLSTAFADTGGSQLLTINVDNHNPPFMYGDGESAQGLYPEIIKEVFGRLKIPVRIIAMPWKRALAMSIAGQAGIAGVYKTDDRLKVLDFSKPFY